jgi:hypothetical protein
MLIFKRSLVFVTLSVALVNTAFSWGCDGDVPWDPCGVLTSDSVPDNESDAKVFLSSVPETAKQIHNSPLTIDVIEKMGLLGDYTEKNKNGAALELLMWESGFHLPTRNITYTKPYAVNDFYNGSYGYQFKMFVAPFDYGKGWNRCQFLKYTPTQAQIDKANEILNQFNNLIQAITTPYENKASDKETSQELIDRQTKFNNELMNAVKHFDYDAYMAYASSELDSYLKRQGDAYYRGEQYANWGCKKEISGQVIY